MHLFPRHLFLLILLISSPVLCSVVLLQVVLLVLGHVGHVVLEGPAIVSRVMLVLLTPNWTVGTTPCACANKRHQTISNLDCMLL